MGSEIRLDRVTITMRDGKPVVRIAVEADSITTGVRGTKTVTERLALYETPMFKAIDPALVQAVITAVEESVRNNVQRLK